MKAIVNNSCCQIFSREKLPRKTVGKTLEAEFSDDWEGLAITAIFEAGTETRDVVYTGEPIVIPWEVLLVEGLSVMLGFHGALPDGTIVKKTVPEWINNVSPSLDPAGASSSDPTPDWAAQVQAIATEAKEVADCVRSDADAGKFNGQAGEPGGWYTPAVTQPDANTMRFSFEPSKEGMPAVPEKDITIPGGSGGSGENGGYYAPSVDDEGNLSWTASKSDMPDVPPSNIKGQKGDKGDKGDTGETGPTGEKGDKGDTGTAGADGKSAYQYAVEGGYTGTEAAFSEKLATVTGEPDEDDIPKVFFGGDLPQEKTDTIMSFRYISKTYDISGYCITKAQGSSSMFYPKKNQTVKLYKDAECTEKLKVDFKGWGKQNKHCYKANWIDLSHARNIVSARLWADVVKSRANYAELPEELRMSPNQGAVDGFPVKMYANGVYQGRYTLNIPKDKWAYNMDDELETHCILQGENYVSGCFRASTNITGGGINGDGWCDELHDTCPAGIVTKWNEIIDFVQNSTDAEFYANLGNYFDIPSLIDYHLFGLASCGLDAYGKNQMYLTYDGGAKWIANVYDMDSTWGLYSDGSKIVATDYARTEYEDFSNGRAGNLLYIRLEALFYEEMKIRWAELRENVLSIENVINRFERFTDIVPAELVKEDYASTTAGGSFTGIPSQSTNNIQQIRSFALARLAWTDEYVSGLTHVESIPCTGITLSATELTFTESKSQTLTATVEPEDTTDIVGWSVDNSSVVTVSNGIITPVGNGSCVVIATCGSFSAACAITVNVPEVVLNLSGLLKSNFINGYKLDSSSGEVVSGTTNNNTTREFVGVEAGSTIFINVNGITSNEGNSIFVCEYDENYSFIKHTEISKTKRTDYTAFLTLQEATKHIRIQVNYLTSTTTSTLSAGIVQSDMTQGIKIADFSTLTADRRYSVISGTEVTESNGSGWYSADIVAVTAIRYMAVKVSEYSRFDVVNYNLDGSYLKGYSTDIINGVVTIVPIEFGEWLLFDAINLESSKVAICIQNISDEVFEAYYF